MDEFEKLADYLNATGATLFSIKEIKWALDALGLEVSPREGEDDEPPRQG